MRYLSVCSGIEAATVAWHGMGWQPVGFADIEAFPSAVLAHHYPTVPNYGDMTTFKEWDIGAIDLLVGGTPCQSFSVAGLRKGMADPRGNLALTYCGILDHFKPKWFVWENVPGVLSSAGGRDFGSFLGAVGEIGYGFAYRVLDAQWFGVAQRRRRVFVVGCLGDWRSAAEVLFESESLRWDLAPSREKRQEVAGTIAARFGISRNNHEECVAQVAPTVTGGPPYSRTGNERVECEAIVLGNVEGGNATTLSAREYKGLSCGRDGMTSAAVVYENPTAYSIREDATANNFSATPLETSTALQALRPSVQSHHAQVFVAQPMAVRRLTPTECERLQGFPDGYTNIPWRKKDESPDSLRYKALGNSMAVPVMKWIGNRINNMEQL
jgi:DNA (cytosine-5)-methyltransferase 1